MEIKERKIIEREKYRSISAQHTNTDHKKVKENVKKFLRNLGKKKPLTDHIAIYWPLDNEVDLTELRNEYPLALPKCIDRNTLKYSAWDGLEQSLEKDFKGIKSPQKVPFLEHYEVSLIFTPCLSIDKNLTRLGYGGGYFDKLRAQRTWRDVPCIGILFDKCVSRELLSRATWDIPLNGYITEKEILV